MSRRRKVTIGLVASIAGLFSIPAPVIGTAPPEPAPTAPGPVEYAPGDRTFYAVPDPIPAGAHGDLLRWQRIDDPFSIRYRIMYLSESGSDTPIVVTALVEAPEDIAPFGGWKLLLHGRSATGFADVCAPSIAVEPTAADRDPADDFEAFSGAQGWVVVSTDYEGVGVPGRTPLLVGVSAGRSMLDAGRAARQLPPLYVGPKTAIAGHSDGGHAALWAAQLASEWTPELELVGTVVAAPTSDLASTSTAALSQPQFETFPVAAAAGLAATDPAALVSLVATLTPAGSQLLQHWDGHCFDDDAGLAGPYFVADPAVTEPFATLMVENTAGTTATVAPLLIFDSDQDTLVTAAQSDALLARLCAAGQVVERRTVADATHDSLRSPLRIDGVDWLTAIADGTGQPASSCAAPSGLMTPPRPEATSPTGPVEYAPDDRTFYAPPDPMPVGEHGDLVRWQAIEGGFGHRYRVMYVAETVAGAPTVATALVEAPPEAPPFGGWRTLLYGHGTSGLADICSPSRAIDDDVADGDVAMEVESIGHATSDGWVVVSADYEGLGGPGSHPLLVGVSEGRSMLDAGRAAHQIPGLYLGPTTAIAGFSQGGHAALWAAQLAAEWTPEQEIIATVVGAPASEPAALASWSAAEGSALAAGIVAGLAVAYPDAAANLGQVLTPNGMELVHQWDTHCFAEAVDVPPPYVTADPSTVEPFAALMAANTAGTVATPAPLLIFHGDADERVPIEHSEALLARLCGAGQVVERRVIPGGLHVGSSGALSLDGLAWLTGVADGTTTPTSSCAS